MNDEARHAALAWDVRAWLEGRLTSAERALVHGAYERALAALGEESPLALADEDRRALGLPSATTTHALARLWAQATDMSRATLLAAVLLVSCSKRTDPPSAVLPTACAEVSVTALPTATHPHALGRYRLTLPTSGSTLKSHEARFTRRGITPNGEAWAGLVEQMPGEGRHPAASRRAARSRSGGVVALGPRPNGHATSRRRRSAAR